MDKRKKIRDVPIVLPNGRQLLVPLYEKRGYRRFLMRASYGVLEAYGHKATKDEDLRKLAWKVYQREPEAYFDRPFYEEGRYIYVLGRRKILTTDASLKGDGRYFYYPSSAKGPITTYRRLFLSYLKERIVEIGKRYGLDLSRTTIRTGFYLSYYGCCFPTKDMLKFDYRLFAYEKDVLDTVLYHEVTHFKARHHDRRFYTLLYLYCPAYDERQKDLKDGRFEGNGPDNHEQGERLL